MNAPCTLPRPAYTDLRGVRNLYSGLRTRQTCGFFVPPRLDSVYGLEGREIPEYPPPPVAVLNLQAAPYRASLNSEIYRSANHGQ